MNAQYRAVCERLDWSITTDGHDNIELEKRSPAGEDFTITVGEEGFVDNVKAYADSFNQEEHIEMWVIARRSGTTAHINWWFLTPHILHGPGKRAGQP